MKHLSLCLFLFLTNLAFGQKPALYINGGPAIMKYNGELGSYDNSSGSIQLGLQFNKKEKINGALNIGFGSITGQDINFGPRAEISTAPTPNRFFKSNFIFINYEVHYNFIKKENFNLYFSQGAGFFRFNPQDDLDNDLQELPETRSEGETYRNAALMLPTSVGGMYFLDNDFGVGLQFGFYNTLTSYLDNISELGDGGNDNILFFKLAVYAPLQ